MIYQVKYSLSIIGKWRFKKVVKYLSIPIKELTTEYYLNNDEVFFIYSFNKVYEMDENAIPDFKKFKKTEKRYYFDNNGTLIRYIEDGKIYNKGYIPLRSRYIEDNVNIPKTTFELEKEGENLK